MSEDRYVEGDEYRKVKDRLKTLEEYNALQKKMVKFIMENSYYSLIDNLLAEVDNSKERKSLQDIWDEENEPTFEEMRIKNKEIADEMLKPTVKEDRIPDDKLEWEPTVKECDSIPVVISYGKEEKIEEIISEYNKNFPDDMFRYQYYKESTEEWLRDKLKEL